MGAVLNLNGPIFLREESHNSKILAVGYAQEGAVVDLKPVDLTLDPRRQAPDNVVYFFTCDNYHANRH